MATKQKPKRKSSRVRLTYIPNPTRTLPDALRHLLDGPDGLENTLRRIGSALAGMHRDLRIVRTHLHILDAEVAAARVPPARPKGAKP